MNLVNSVRNNEKAIFLNKGAVAVKVQTQLRNGLSNSERKKATRNHPLIHAILIIGVMNIMVRNQIRASAMDRRII